MDGSERLTIAASPHTVHAVVSDVTRHPEWSPECRRARRLGGGAPGGAGPWLRGWNASGILRWSRRCRVEVAEPGREFTFLTRGRPDSTRWSYRIYPGPEGTVLEEAWQVVVPLPAWARRLNTLLDPRRLPTDQNVRASLAKIARLCEREQAHRDGQLH